MFHIVLILLQLNRYTLFHRDRFIFFPLFLVRLSSLCLQPARSATATKRFVLLYEQKEPSQFCHARVRVGAWSLVNGEACMSSASSICSNMLWYVIHCRPKKERFVASVLHHHLGLATFLPEEQFDGKAASSGLPLFPGYLFVLANLQQIPLSRINASPGVIRLIEFDGMPLTVPHACMKTLYEASRTLHTLCFGANISSMFEDVLHDGSALATAAIGAPISATRDTGMLHQFFAYLQELQRKSVSSETPAAIVSQPRRIRLTRGKGRRIKNVVARSRDDIL